MNMSFSSQAILKQLSFVILISHLSSGDNLALLSGTLRTYQKAACDEEWVSLKCPEGTTISIQFTQYGRTASSPTLCKDIEVHPGLEYSDATTPTNKLTCLWHSAIQTVVGLCQKKPECKFLTTPRTFGGDPCPYTRKFVEVAYKCRPSEFRSVIGCENENVQLSCRKGFRLAIYDAKYGRSEYESLACPQTNGLQEETCLASYATETVMQMCHGKRRCSIFADSATFGSPCNPMSRMYLKVIHTCVPRKVLKEKYQGEPELDEMEDEEFDKTDDEENDFTSKINEQISIPSENYPQGSEKTVEPFQEQNSEEILKTHPGDSDDSHARSSAVLNSEVDIHQTENNSSNPGDTQDVQLIYLISQGMNAYHYISRNSQTFWLLISISMLCVFLLLLFLLLIRLVYLRRKGKKAKEQQKKKSSTIRRASGLSDIDELSLVMDPDEYIHLSTIQRRSNPNPTYAGLSKNTVVRYSNSRAATLGRQESDTNPRSFNREHESDIHFFFG